MTYSEKLKDPRWQVKRQEILELDKQKCRNCLSRDNLQVHHRAYLSGAEPWQYPDEFLITLCENCHSTEEYYKRQIKPLCDTMSLKGITYEEIYKYLERLDQPKNG